VVEHGDNQHDAVAALMTEAGLIEISGHADLTGTTRVTSGLKA
jgi:methylase of polypeptide subunit release factors